MNNDGFNIARVAEIAGLKPDRKPNGELRFGKKGSLSLDPKNGTYFDFEAGKGGGTLELIMHLGLANNMKQAAEWGIQNGVINCEHSHYSEPSREHIYEDQQGKPIRKSIKKQDGTWSQMRFENGDWKYGVKNIQNVPYGLSRLIEDYTDKDVFIFEGEKDCELAWKHGLSATTNVGGAGNWKDELNEHLKGRNVWIVPDNDEAGTKHAKSVKASLDRSGIACCILWAIQKLVPTKGDFSDYLNKDGNTVDIFLELLEEEQLEPDKTQPLFHFKSISDLAGKPIPDRDWLIRDWIPGNQVTLLYGDGGTGKSQIAMQLCLAVASDRPWLQLPTANGRSLYLSAEDDEDELHRRFANIARGMCLDLSNFANCRYLSLAGEDALFAVQDKNNQTLQHSPLFDAFCEAIKKYQPKVAVVDTLADVYPADENQRNAARQFIQLLRKPAIENNCAVIVLAHPSLTGLNSGSGTSGSTAWSNSVRSRLYFTRATGEDTDPDLRVLELMKSNYSRIGTTVNVRWRDGVFVHESGGTQLDRAALNAKAERVFLQLLDAYTEQGRPVNQSSGSNYAPTVFASDPKAEGITKVKFVTAMKSLFHKKVIISEVRKGNRGSLIVRNNT